MHHTLAWTLKTDAKYYKKERDRALAIKALGIFWHCNSELPCTSQHDGCYGKGKVECFDRTAMVMDSTCSPQQSFYGDALRMGPLREVEISWVEIASQAEKIVKAKAF